MDEFIFGPLPSVPERLNLEYQRRSGLTHLQDRQPPQPASGQPVTVWLNAGASQPVSRAWVYWSADGQDPHGALGQALHGCATEMLPAASLWDTPQWGYIRRFSATLPGQPQGTVVRYRISAVDGAGQERFADAGVQYAYLCGRYAPPAWSREAILYQVFLDRFSPSPGQDWQQTADLAMPFGGTLAGLTSRLGYLHSLGVNTLWLSPVFPSPHYHGYDPSDYFTIEPRLGTLADFRELLAAAHNLGLRVLLDFVPNHGSDQHPLFLAAQRDEHSPFHDWFHFTHWPDAYAGYFDLPHMPLFNLRHPGARQYMLDSAVFWLSLGVDGFRVDHASGPSPDFWPDFLRTVRAANPEAWVFGEMTDPPPLQLGLMGGLDGMLDFLLTEKLRRAFFRAALPADQLAGALERHDAYFPPEFSRPSFLDNHDMNRALWAAKGDARKVRLAALFQFILPGQPILYQGCEQGLSQCRDVLDPQGGSEEARLPNCWEGVPDPAMLAFYRELIRLRRSEPALGSRRRATLFADPCLAVFRLDPEGPEGSPLLMLMNLGETERTWLAPGKWTVRAPLGEGVTATPVKGETRLTLPAWTGQILSPAGE